MKKLLFTTLFFVLTPFTSFAAIDYSRSPSGESITSPVSFSVSLDNFSDLGFDEEAGVLSWKMLAVGVEAYWGNECILATDLSSISNMSIAVGENINIVNAKGYASTDCSGDGINPDNYFEGDGNYTMFTIISGLKSGVLFGRSGESQQANQDGGTLLAAIGFVSTDTFGGIFPYLMLSIGLFIGLYIIQKIIFILNPDPDLVKIKKRK